MREQKENIGMWSLYGQPWESGVKVSLERSALTKWIKSIDRVYYADPETKLVDKENFCDLDKYHKPFFSVVAYTNNEDKEKNETEQLSVGKAKNSILKEIYSDERLTCYIKNQAWSYEKEVRLRVELDNPFPAIALKIPENLISGIVVTKGPRFKGDLEESIKKEIPYSIKTEKSLFFNKIYHIQCDVCSWKKENNYNET